MDASAQHSLINPTTCFTIACVAFSMLAVSTVWRNQQSPEAAKRKHQSVRQVSQPRPQPRRRVAVDSLYAASESPAYIINQSEVVRQGSETSSAVVLSELLQRCARLVQQLRAAPQFTTSRITITSLLGELSLLTTTLCRLQQACMNGASHVSPKAEQAMCFEATTSSVDDILSLMETEVQSSHGDSALLQEALQQLRDQRPALEFLIATLSASPLPPTPPSETTMDHALRTDNAQLSSLLSPFIPSTGLTPSIDARGWIEPPPEYSPPAHGALEVAVDQKADSKHTEPTLPEEQPQVHDEVYDTDALYNAVTNDDVNLIGDLLEHGADANAAIGDLQRTALHQAAHLNNTNALSVLLRSGAVMTTEDAKGDTPLHLAAWAGHMEALTALLAHGADIDWLSGRDGYSPLWCSISAYHIDAARMLLRQGARVSLRSASGNGLLPLHQAAVTGQSAMCELLLERGAQVDNVDDDKNTPLHYAAASGSAASVKVLLRGGADVTTTQMQGLTPAHWASHKGHTEVLTMLLAYGAPVNITAEEGATPLHLAANRGHKQAVRLLLEKGANRTAKAAWDGAQGTAAQMAGAKGHVKVTHLIESWAS